MMWPPDMEGSCEYVECAVGVSLQLEDKMDAKCYTGATNLTMNLRIA
jgi:hypothetical protein